MCSTAAGSAIAVSSESLPGCILLQRPDLYQPALQIQVISVQDLFYDNKMNAGVAIFTLLASQLIGYGMAGMLTDLTVKPSYSIFPAKISLANTFQALHFDGGLGTKRTKFFWGVFAFMFVYESEFGSTRNAILFLC